MKELTQEQVIENRRRVFSVNKKYWADEERKIRNQIKKEDRQWVKAMNKKFGIVSNAKVLAKEERELRKQMKKEDRRWEKAMNKGLGL